jgi:imidazolonepropionase-like amidohydrolase
VIKEFGQADQAAADVIDCGGRTLMPADRSHVHVVLSTS